MNNQLPVANLQTKRNECGPDARILQTYFQPEGVGGSYGVRRRRGGTTNLLIPFFVLAHDLLHHSF